MLALANPTPEIMPEEARRGAAAVVGTGRSDFPNQVNNVLAFPGIFRGALDAGASSITEEMKIAAARALATATSNPSPDRVLPDPLDRSAAPQIATAVASAARSEPARSMCKTPDRFLSPCARDFYQRRMLVRSHSLNIQFWP